jgi:hypothetical protein
MKTLVIHPADRSTDFLKKIYEGKDWTINNDFLGSRKKVIKQIKEHDRIIMMGHGCSSGLFFTPINQSMVYLLRKKELIFIWCHANKFLEEYKLKGFSTSMFCSEVGECRYYNMIVSQEEVDYSNNLFATELNKVIDNENMYQLIKELYNGNDPVIQFNNKGLLVF